MENQALIDALEQARSALDQVEAAAVQGRRDKLKKPLDEAGPNETPGEIDGINDEQE